LLGAQFGSLGAIAGRLIGEQFPTLEITGSVESEIANDPEGWLERLFSEGEEAPEHAPPQEDMTPGGGYLPGVTGGVRYGSDGPPEGLEDFKRREGPYGSYMQQAIDLAGPEQPSSRGGGIQGIPQLSNNFDPAAILSALLGR
jgi:hypothetical protein